MDQNLFGQYTGSKHVVEVTSDGKEREVEMNGEDDAAEDRGPWIGPMLGGSPHDPRSGFKIADAKNCMSFQGQCKHFVKTLFVQYMIRFGMDPSGD